MPTLTTNYSWKMPLVADPTDEDLWGGYLNENLASQDTIVKAISDVANAATAAVTVIYQNSQSADYTLVLADAGKHIYHPVGDANNRTWTIPANASVAYPIGTPITFVNRATANTIAIAITSDTLTLAQQGTTGTRTLAAYGVATALKITTTEWLISGTGLT